MEQIRQSGRAYGEGNYKEALDLLLPHLGSEYSEISETIFTNALATGIQLRRFEENALIGADTRVLDDYARAYVEAHLAQLCPEALNNALIYFAEDSMLFDRIADHMKLENVREAIDGEYLGLLKKSVPPPPTKATKGKQIRKPPAKKVNVTFAQLRLSVDDLYTYALVVWRRARDAPEGLVSCRKPFTTLLHKLIKEPIAVTNPSTELLAFLAYLRRSLAYIELCRVSEKQSSQKAEILNSEAALSSNEVRRGAAQGEVAVAATTEKAEVDEPVDTKDKIDALLGNGGLPPLYFQTSVPAEKRKLVRSQIDKHFDRLLLLSTIDTAYIDAVETQRARALGYQNRAELIEVQRAFNVFLRSQNVRTHMKLCRALKKLDQPDRISPEGLESLTQALLAFCVGHPVEVNNFPFKLCMKTMSEEQLQLAVNILLMSRYTGAMMEWADALAPEATSSATAPSSKWRLFAKEAPKAETQTNPVRSELAARLRAAVAAYEPEETLAPPTAPPTDSLAAEYLAMRAEEFVDKVELELSEETFLVDADTLCEEFDPSQTLRQRRLRLFS